MATSQNKLLKSLLQQKLQQGQPEQVIRIGIFGMMILDPKEVPDLFNIFFSGNKWKGFINSVRMLVLRGLPKTHLELKQFADVIKIMPNLDLLTLELTEKVTLSPKDIQYFFNAVGCNSRLQTLELRNSFFEEPIFCGSDIKDFLRNNKNLTAIDLTNSGICTMPLEVFKETVDSILENPRIKTLHLKFAASGGKLSEERQAWLVQRMLANTTLLNFDNIDTDRWQKPYWQKEISPNYSDKTYEEILNILRRNNKTKIYTPQELVERRKQDLIKTLEDRRNLEVRVPIFQSLHLDVLYNFEEVMEALKTNTTITRITVVSPLKTVEQYNQLLEVIKTKPKLRHIEFLSYGKSSNGEINTWPSHDLKSLCDSLSQNPHIECISIGGSSAWKGFDNEKAKILSDTLKNMKTLKRVSFFNSNIGTLKFDIFKQIIGAVLANPHVEELDIEQINYQKLPVPYQNWLVQQMEANTNIVALDSIKTDLYLGLPEDKRQIIRAENNSGYTSSNLKAIIGILIRNKINKKKTCIEDADKKSSTEIKVAVESRSLEQEAAITPKISSASVEPMLPAFSAVKERELERTPTESSLSSLPDLRHENRGPTIPLSSSTTEAIDISATPALSAGNVFELEIPFLCKIKRNAYG